MIMVWRYALWPDPPLGNHCSKPYNQLFNLVFEMKSSLQQTPFTCIQILTQTFKRCVILIWLYSIKWHSVSRFLFAVRKCSRGWRVEVSVGIRPGDITGIHPSSVLPAQRFHAVVVNVDCGVAQLQFLLDCGYALGWPCRCFLVRYIAPFMFRCWWIWLAKSTLGILSYVFVLTLTGLFLVYCVTFWESNWSIQQVCETGYSGSEQHVGYRSLTSVWGLLILAGRSEKCNHETLYKRTDVNER